MRTLALIPHYNHPTTIARVAQTMHGFGLDVLIVDDGSREECKPVLQALVSDGIHVLYRPINGGKGAAVKTGLKYAEENGYSHVLQVDADGQHHLDDTPKLLAAAEQNPEAVVCGWPQYGGDAPKARLYGRKITDFWNMLHTWSCDIKDGMCGFRLYPLPPRFLSSAKKPLATAWISIRKSSSACTGAASSRFGLKRPCNTPPTACPTSTPSPTTCASAKCTRGCF